MSSTDFRACRPGPDDFAPFYSGYVARVPDGDIVATLTGQITETRELLQSISASQAGFRYAPGKWTIRQLLGHVIDGERVFGFRALWFARGGVEPLPSMNQELFVANAGHDSCPWSELIEEFDRIRAATLDLVRRFGEPVWLNKGTASGSQVSVRGLVWIIAGHERHHRAVLREKYLPNLQSQ